MSASSILLAVGPRGLPITPPLEVELLPLQSVVQSDPPLPVSQQKELVKAALQAPQGMSPLKELATGHRRVAILAGDLSLPAPYDSVLTVVEQILEETEIRPTRVSLLACPGGNGPLLGRAAVHRYGEDFVGDHECRAWTWSDPEQTQPEALYASADLRIAVRPRLPGIALLPSTLNYDVLLELELGKKAAIDIIGARALPFLPTTHKQDPSNQTATADADVYFTTGGGSEWEETLEEALLSLHLLSAPAGRTAVLALDGTEGLGSARFTLDLWSLLDQAEQILATASSLTHESEEITTSFDPAATVAHALSQHKHVVLFSKGLSEHIEGDDLQDRLQALPNLATKLHLCSTEPALWETLARLQGSRYRLLVNPLGWRALC